MPEATIPTLTSPASPKMEPVDDDGGMVSLRETGLPSPLAKTKSSATTPAPSETSESSTKKRGRDHSEREDSVASTSHSSGPAVKRRATEESRSASPQLPQGRNETVEEEDDDTMPSSGSPDADKAIKSEEDDPANVVDALRRRNASLERQIRLMRYQSQYQDRRNLPKPLCDVLAGAGAWSLDASVSLKYRIYETVANAAAGFRRRRSQSLSS